MCHQVRTIAAQRARPLELSGGRGIAYVTDPAIRRDVRDALGRHLGLDIEPEQDGATG